MIALLALGLAVAGAGCGAGSPRFDGRRAVGHVTAQCDLGPRPAGSEAARANAEYISKQLMQSGWEASNQDFAYRGIALRNVVGRRGQAGPVVILGAHYDTRAKADRDPANPAGMVLGANDGASGVAVLLELARTLGATSRPVMLAFFDGEDQGELGGWEWAVGASYMANSLTEPAAAMILVDMVGDADQQLFWEGNSDPALRQRLWDIAAELGYQSQFVGRVRHTLIDDHVPFLRRGIPAVDIIDFDYPYWHTTKDTPDKVSAASLERVGRVLEYYLTH